MAKRKGATPEATEVTNVSAGTVRAWCLDHSDLFPTEVTDALKAGKGRLPAHAVQVFEFQNPTQKYGVGLGSRPARAAAPAKVPVPSFADGKVTITEVEKPLNEVRALAADLGLTVADKGRVSSDILAAVGAALAQD